ncbi:hypothetical protein [Actinomyces sp.]
MFRSYPEDNFLSRTGEAQQATTKIAPLPDVAPQNRTSFDCMNIQQHPETLQFQRSQFKL